MRITMTTTLDDMVRTLRRLAHQATERAALEKHKERARQPRQDMEESDAGST